jgi:hypothetical protein
MVNSGLAAGYSSGTVKSISKKKSFSLNLTLNLPYFSKSLISSNGPSNFFSSPLLSSTFLGCNLNCDLIIGNSFHAGMRLLFSIIDFKKSKIGNIYGVPLYPFSGVVASFLIMFSDFFRSVSTNLWGIVFDLSLRTTDEFG